MKITREQFESQEVLTAMDEIALLLYVSQSLRRMAPTFQSSAYVDKETEADQPARVVLRAVRKVASSLMEPLFFANVKRDESLAAARSEGLETLRKAFKSAQKLAALERETLKQTTALGTGIQKTVLLPLSDIITRWSAAV